MFKLPFCSKLSFLLRHKSIQNFIFLFFIQTSNVVISLVSIPLLIQNLGVDQFGLVNLALSVIFFANVAVTFGYNLSGPREIAVNQDDRQAMGEVASKIFFSKFLFALLLCLLLGVLIYIFGFFGDYQVVLLFSLLLLFSEATQSIWLFQGLEKMRMVSLANLFAKLLYLLVLVLYIKAPEDAKWVNFLLGVTALGVNLLLVAYIHFGLHIKLFLPKWKALWMSWKENFFLFLSGVASHFSVSGGLIILSFFASATILGMFSMAEKITMVLRMVPTLITQAAYPNASKLFASDQLGFYAFLKKVYLGALAVSLCIAVLVFLTAPQIIWLLSKEKLEESVHFLKLLSVVPFLASLNIANMIIILVGGLNRLLFDATWTFCCFMLVSCSILSYLFGGVGLAYGLLATELFIFLACSVLLKFKTRHFEAFYKRLVSSHYFA
jgi:O-antigen/teichoic acid export membrane protein